MTTTDLNVLYNARIVVPNHADYSDRWEERAAAYRAQADGELDTPYGEGEREKFDFFSAGDAAPVCVYIHGGYWRSRDRKTFSHVAAPLNARGVSVAIPSYDLAPNVSIPHIISQMRACVAAVWQKTQVRPAVAGHSAGGHLAACMLATDWSKVAGVPDDLVASAVVLSGLFDLRPLVALDINEELRLTPEDAEAASPALWTPPRAGLRCVAAVGGEETAPFHEQSRGLVESWAQGGMETEFMDVPGCNHFSIVDTALDGSSPLFNTLLAMIAAHEAA